MESQWQSEQSSTTGHKVLYFGMYFSTTSIEEKKRSNNTTRIWRSYLPSRYHCQPRGLFQYKRDYHFNIDCIVLPKITGHVPSSYIQHHSCNLPENLSLADPTFYTPQATDLLIGAQVFMKSPSWKGKLVVMGTFLYLRKPSSDGSSVDDTNNQ